MTNRYDVISLLVNKGAVPISKSQTLDAGHPFSSLLAGLEGFSEVQRLPPGSPVSLVGAQASHDSGDTSKTIKINVPPSQLKLLAITLLGVDDSAGEGIGSFWPIGSARL